MVLKEKPQELQLRSLACSAGGEEAEVRPHQSLQPSHEGQLPSLLFMTRDRTQGNDWSSVRGGLA